VFSIWRRRSNWAAYRYAYWLQSHKSVALLIQRGDSKIFVPCALADSKHLRSRRQFDAGNNSYKPFVAMGTSLCVNCLKSNFARRVIGRISNDETSCFDHCHLLPLLAVAQTAVIQDTTEFAKVLNYSPIPGPNRATGVRGRFP